MGSRDLAEEVGGPGQHGRVLQADPRSYLYGSRQGQGGLLQTLAPPQTGQTLGEGQPELEAGWEAGQGFWSRWGSSPEEEAGAPTSCYCVDVQLGGLEGDTCCAGLKDMLKFPSIAAHVSGRAWWGIWW